MNFIFDYLLTIALILLLVSSNLSAQTISLVNPSFEETPQDATMPAGWHSCKQGTTPDILPGFWGVTTEAFDGETYMGLITRENGTWESIEQRLSETLKKGECYTFDNNIVDIFFDVKIKFIFFPISMLYKIGLF